MNNSLLCLVIFLVLSQELLANTGHWRQEVVSNLSDANGTCDSNDTMSLAKADRLTLAQLGCSNNTPPLQPLIAEFLVHDYDQISDSTLTLVGYSDLSESTGALFVDCVDVQGHVIAPLLNNFPLTASSEINRHLEIPRECFQTEQVRFNLYQSGQGRFVLDQLRLNLRSHFRRASLVSSNLLENGPPLLAQSYSDNEDSDSYRPLGSCQDKPEALPREEFTFDTFDFETIRDAILVLDVRAQDGPATVHLSCFDEHNKFIATIANNVVIERENQHKFLPVPQDCFVGKHVIIRTMPSANSCLGLDLIALDLYSDARESRIERAQSSGQCKTNTQVGCDPELNRNDGEYLKWFACGDRDAYSSPTMLTFAVPEFRTLQKASLVMDTTASGDVAYLRVDCYNASGQPIERVAPYQHYPATPRTYTFDIPAACFQSPKLYLRFARGGPNCIGPDFIRVLTTSTAQENRVPNVFGLQAYSSKMSVQPNEQISFHVSSPYKPLNLDIVRLGLEDQLMLHVENLNAENYDFNVDAYRNGLQWPSAYSFRVPHHWPGGMYVARLYSGANSFPTIFFVSQASTGPRKSNNTIAVLGSTFTWSAYNVWNGKSLYRYFPYDESGRTTARAIAMRLPLVSIKPGGRDLEDNERKGHTAAAERWLLEWLERERYSYTPFSEEALDNNPNILDGYSVLVLNTHSEYWTAGMYDALDRFLDRGGSLLNLSGNTLYSKIVKTRESIERLGLGEVHSDSSRGGKWRELGRPEARVLGVAYDARGYGTSAGYQVTLANHWLFKFTNSRLGETLGTISMPTSSGYGASGLETDKIVEHISPTNILLLAKGLNPNGGGANLTYYQHTGGGGVLSAGSIHFAKGLVIDETLNQLVRNFLDRYQ
ncbi:MAG: hypothetical protein KDD62_03410 [Bdellovibrionales bacterium]|nr:hypothetical protein [Bdellovibrionales bacterium]